jgi:hypothetical protein
MTGSAGASPASAARTSITTTVTLSGPPTSSARATNWRTAPAGSAADVSTSRMARSPTTGLSPSEHSRYRFPGPQVPHAQIGRTIRPAVQVPCEHRGEGTGVPDEIADRVILGDLAKPPAAEPERAGVADVSQRGAVAGEQHRGQRGPHAPPRRVPGGPPGHLPVRLAAVRVEDHPGGRVAVGDCVGQCVRLRKTCKSERAAQIEFGKLLERAAAGRQTDSDVTVAPAARPVRVNPPGRTCPPGKPTSGISAGPSNPRSGPRRSVRSAAR